MNPDTWSPPAALSDGTSEAACCLELAGSLVQPWFDQAACAGLGDLFFADREDGASTRAARAVCRTCPVLSECRAYALTLPVHYPGVWGGMSQRERHRAMGMAA